MSDSPTNPLPKLPRRVLAVFLSPGELFEQLRDKPVWGGAMLLAVVLNLSQVVLMPAELFEDQVRQSLEQAGPEASGDMSVETIVAISRYAAIAGAGFITVGFAVVTALLMRLVFGAVLGDGGRIRQYLSVVTHASLIASIGSLAILPLKISQGNMELTLSIGTFLPLLEDGFARNFVNLLDLFGLWAVMVMAIGAGKVHPGRTWGSAFAILLVFWLLLVAVMAGLAGLGQ